MTYFFVLLFYLYPIMFFFKNCIYLIVFYVYIWTISPPEIYYFYVHSLENVDLFPLLKIDHATDSTQLKRCSII